MIWVQARECPSAAPEATIVWPLVAQGASNKDDQQKELQPANFAPGYRPSQGEICGGRARQHWKPDEKKIHYAGPGRHILIC